MKCFQANKLLLNYINEDLSDNLMMAVSEHHHFCSTCSNEHANMLDILTSLRELPVPALSEDFVERAFKKAAKENGRQKMILPAIGSALTAGLAVLFFYSSTFSPVPTNNSYDVAVGNKVKTIKVAINSAKAINDVSISIELSPNLKLDEFGSRKSIKWNTSLTEGVNIISLPVVGIAAGYGEVTTHIQLNKEEKIMRIKTLYKELESAMRNINTTSVV